MSISLLGREFRVGCPEGEEKQLLASVDYLNRKLKEVRDTGKVSGNERIAIMAALNIAHELMSNEGKGSAHSFDASAYRRRIVAMQETVDSALSADQENLF
ncbi:MAG: cell division protein ZapA [Usitatibacter sp.]